MVFLIGLLLVGISVGVVLWPFVRGRGTRTRGASSPGGGELEDRWNALLDEMVALRLDADLGRIPPQEAQERYQALRTEAARVLKAVREGQGVPPAFPVAPSVSSSGERGPEP
ncbi:MAG: hypothetical protein NZ951_02400 [Dehalococcoidia bacterium]|nr:hypothetical protein [Dehalococcoidia bacterium]MDW8119811.1 hypothetical protein [Chloroflexota bacterium]